MKAENEITIDELARMVANGFSDMDKRFDGLEHEVRTINQRIDTYVVPALEEHSRRIKDLELKVA